MTMPVLKDTNKVPYTPSIGNTPPPVGTPVTIYQPKGPPVGGTMGSGGRVLPNQK